MKNITRLTALPPLAATILALVLGTAWAQGTGPGAAATPAAPSGAAARSTGQEAQKIERFDRRFMVDAANANQFDVQAAQLAITRANDPSVKDYANLMVDHHSTAQRELMQLAASKGLELPTAPTRAMRREIDQLRKKTGAEFDREFVRKIGIREHEREIKRYQNASKNVKDMQLKAWIDKELPGLEQQLAQAQRLPYADTSAAGSGSPATSGAGSNPGVSGAGPESSRNESDERR
jgi:putative membrane protein